MARITSVSDMQKFIKSFDKALEGTANTAVALMLGEIMSRTPVDTSKLVNNWQVTFGAEAVGEVSGAWLETRSKDVVGKNTFVKPIAIAEKIGWLKKLTGSGNIYITNNVPYAHAVEFFGGSIYENQSGGGKPKMMIRGAIPFWSQSVNVAASVHRI